MIVTKLAEIGEWCNFQLASLSLSSQVRGIIYGFCLSLSWIFAFVILRYQESVNQLIGIGGLMLIFSVNSLLGGMFVQLVVPETKDKTFQEISNALEGWAQSSNKVLNKFKWTSDDGRVNPPELRTP